MMPAGLDEITLMYVYDEQCWRLIYTDGGSRGRCTEDYSTQTEGLRRLVELMSP